MFAAFIPKSKVKLFFQMLISHSYFQKNYLPKGIMGISLSPTHPRPAPST